jgi:hypothetical protein
MESEGSNPPWNETSRSMQSFSHCPQSHTVMIQSYLLAKYLVWCSASTLQNTAQSTKTSKTPYAQTQEAHSEKTSFSFSWALTVLPCDSNRSPSIPSLIRDNPNLHKNDILLLLGHQDISTWLQRENCNKHVIWQSKTISSNQTKTKHDKKWVLS